MQGTAPPYGTARPLSGVLTRPREGNPAVGGNTGGPQGHCAQWGQSDTWRPTLCDLTGGVESKHTELPRTENRLAVARGGAGVGDRCRGQKAQTFGSRMEGSGGAQLGGSG